MSWCEDNNPICGCHCANEIDVASDDGAEVEAAEGIRRWIKGANAVSAEWREDNAPIAQRAVMKLARATRSVRAELMSTQVNVLVVGVGGAASGGLYSQARQRVTRAIEGRKRRRAIIAGEGPFRFPKPRWAEPPSCLVIALMGLVL